MERFEKDGCFIARQLTDTHYMARMVRTYLSSLYPERPSDRLPGDGVKGVYVVPGRMTAMLRRLLCLNELLPDHNYAEKDPKRLVYGTSTAVRVAPRGRRITEKKHTIPQRHSTVNTQRNSPELT